MRTVDVLFVYLFAIVFFVDKTINILQKENVYIAMAVLKKGGN